MDALSRWVSFNNRPSADDHVHKSDQTGSNNIQVRKIIHSNSCVCSSRRSMPSSADESSLCCAALSDAAASASNLSLSLACSRAALIGCHLSVLIWTMPLTSATASGQSWICNKSFSTPLQYCDKLQPHIHPGNGLQFLMCIVTLMATHQLGPCMTPQSVLA